MKIAFLVNPIAGLGGSVGLKGTDNLAQKAFDLGAKPQSGLRANQFLTHLGDYAKKIEFLTCSSHMGADYFNEIPHTVKYQVLAETTREDTLNAVKKLNEESPDLIVFCGGDGTARDVFEANEIGTTLLGVPAGVKMHSAVFGLTPKASAEVVKKVFDGTAKFCESEVLDVDEIAYSAGKLSVKLFGLAKTPYIPQLIQAGKHVHITSDDEKAKSEIAKFASEFMIWDTSYILGAGSTTNAIAKRLGVEKTVLGVDIILNGKIVVKDASEKSLIDYLTATCKTKIIVSPIGAQGFLFGRGNQQISAKVIKLVGAENIIYVSSPQKLNQTPKLFVDTSDDEVDDMLCGYKSVVIGYRMAQKKTVESFH